MMDAERERERGSLSGNSAGFEARLVFNRDEVFF